MLWLLAPCNGVKKWPPHPRVVQGLIIVCKCLGDQLIKGPDPLLQAVPYPHCPSRHCHLPATSWGQQDRWDTLGSLSCDGFLYIPWQWGVFQAALTWEEFSLLPWWVCVTEAADSGVNLE